MQKLITLISYIEKKLAILFVGIMTSLVIFDVISREVFNIGLPWAQKAAVYLMIWSGFLGAIMIAEKAAHLRPEIADKLWGEKGQILFVRVQNFFLIAFYAAFTYASFLYVSESYSFGDKSVVLDVPLWLLQIIIPYTFISMGIRSLNFLIFPTRQLSMAKEIH